MSKRLDRLFLVSQTGSIDNDLQIEEQPTQTVVFSPVSRNIVGQSMKFQEQELKQEFRSKLERMLLKMQGQGIPFVFKDAKTKHTLREPMPLRQIVDDLIRSRIQILLGSKEAPIHRRRRGRVWSSVLSLNSQAEAASFQSKLRLPANDPVSTASESSPGLFTSSDVDLITEHKMRVLQS